MGCHIQILTIYNCTYICTGTHYTGTYSMYASRRFEVHAPYLQLAGLLRCLCVLCVFCVKQTWAPQYMVSICMRCFVLCPMYNVHTKGLHSDLWPLRSTFIKCTFNYSQIHSSLLGDKVDYGIGLSYRPAILCSLTGRYDSQMLLSTLSPQAGAPKCQHEMFPFVSVVCSTISICCSFVYIINYTLSVLL